MQSLVKAWEELGAPHVAVIGDLILDRYLWGRVDRISPEAPVIVLREEREEYRLGGAASVAQLLRGLDCHVSLAGAIGADLEGRRLMELAEAAGIEVAGVIVDGSRPTSLKTRLLGSASGREPQQLMRLDRESAAPLGPAFQDRLATAAANSLSRSDAVLISDYNKGVCSERLIRQCIALASDQSLPLAIDPAKGVAFDRYHGAPVVTPNRFEAAFASGLPVTTTNAELVGAQIAERGGHSQVVLKLDRDGICVCGVERQPRWCQGAPRQVCDVTGAGDMVLAVLGACLGAGWSIDDAAVISNVAAGLEVEQIGVTPISRAEISTALGLSHSRRRGQRVSVSAAERCCRTWQTMGQRIVFTNGCFDLLHVGHLHCLEQAAALGDRLVVAVNSDASVRRLKGSERPTISEDARANLLAGLACVDLVLVMNEDTPHAILEALRPDVLAKGAPYSPDEVVGKEIVLSYGGQIAITSAVSGVSTSQILSGLRG